MKMSSRTRFILLWVTCYVVLALAWIFLSDHLLKVVVNNENLIALSTAKGIFFVLASGAGFFLALRSVPSLSAVHSELAINFLIRANGRWRVLMYLFAVVVTVSMLYLGSMMLARFGNQPLLILLMLPIILSALIGGLGPGLVATACAALGANYLVTNYWQTTHSEVHGQFQWILLIVNGIAVSGFSAILQRSLIRLEHSRNLLKSIIQGTSDAIFVKDNHGRYVLVNEAGAAFVNKSAQEVIGLSDKDLFDAESVQTISILDQAILSKGWVQTHEERLTVLGGLTRFFLVTKGAILNQHGKIEGLFGISRNITEQKNIELELISREAALNQAQHLAHVGSWKWDIKADLHDWSKEIYHIYGRDTALPAATYPEVQKYFTPSSWAILSHHIEEALLQMQPYTCEAQVIRENGELRWVCARGEPVCNERGELIAFHGTLQDISDQKQAQSLLKEREQQLERVISGSNQGYWDWNLQTDVLQVSAYYETMLGYMPGEMKICAENWVEVIHPDDLILVHESITHHLLAKTASHTVEMRCKTKQGDWLWILSCGRIVSWCADGSPLMMSGTHTDISERKCNDLALRESGVVFENSYEGIMVLGADRRIAKINPAFTRITGYSEAEAIGQSPNILSSGRHDTAFYQQMWDSLSTKDFWRGEISNRRKSGEIYVELLSISVVRDTRSAIQYYVGIFTDITQQKAHEIELDRVAHYDALTGLPNRRLLSDRLKHAIQRTDRSGKSCAICFLDFDGFKAINDQYGHAIGDQLLVKIAEQLQAVLRADDTLARLGGDEFVLTPSQIPSPTESALLLDRVLAAAASTVHITELSIRISASIGVSLYPEDNVDPDTLLRHADQAMYLAKEAGKNCYQLFDPENDRQAQLHRKALEFMWLALERNEFVLHYQPKVDLVSGEVIGAEALIRWHHPESGLLLPAEFLSHLYGSELEYVLGEWVIHAALKQMAQWIDLGLKIRVSVNVSANHLLRTDFADKLHTALLLYPEVPRSYFELEVLETAAIGDMQQAIETLNRCKAMGVKFSLDDFGTGYSSLTYLRKLPIDTLKIDQSFVRDMLTDPDDLGIVKGVIQLAAAFNRQVIAEGVETMAHGALLRQLGCHLVQGYGVARPMPAEDFPAWCSQWKHQAAWLDIAPYAVED